MSFSSSLSDIGDSIKKNFDSLSADFLSQINGAQGRNVAGAASALPWDSVNSRFYTKINIDPDRWDQLFPYRLIVVDSRKGNQVVNGTREMNIKIKKDLGRTSIDFAPLSAQWIYTLPITPQQLNITDQFAINTTATMAGVLEEHNGVKFKMINAQGSMGIWPFRESVTTPPPSPDIVQSVFGGLLEAASSTLSQIARTINTATGNTGAPRPAAKRPETSTAGKTSTGYYHAMALQQFLEQYAEAKKDPANAGWRLVFDIPKQNQSLVVTPMTYVWSQNATRPAEINYNFQLKGWRRIDLNPKVDVKSSVQPLSPGILQRIMNTISESRKTLSSITDLIGAVRSDVTRPLEVLRQTSLFVKDLAGVVVTAADLPFQVQRDYKYAISDFFKSLSSSEILRNAATDPAVAQALSDLKIGWSRAEGVGSDSIRTGQLGPGASQAQSIDPGLALLDKPEQNHSLIDIAPVFNLKLNEAQQASVDQALSDARSTTVDDLKTFRSVIQDLSLQISNNFGSGDSYYSQIYGRPTPTQRIQPLTLDEYQILRVLYDVMQSYDLLTATTQVDDLQKKTNMAYVAGLANDSDIVFNTTDSKILVPVPFGLTIESIALRYLGNPHRWLEIATLNNLRDPYIDENGFQRPFLSNGSGRQITISSAENLYVGQRVVLRSSTQVESARRILGLDRLSETSYLVTLDGEANLQAFTTSDKAYLQAYLPGTTNSQQKIFIPSDLPVSNDARIIIPSAVQGDPLAGLSKVDLLLTDSGDLAVNSYGDLRISAGMTNLIQALKIKFGTQKGRVLLHPDFGLGVKVGQMVSDTDVHDIFDSINKMIQEDTRFDGLDNLQVQIDGPTLTINMGVRLAGNNGVFPVAFELPA